MLNGAIAKTGKVGSDVTVEEAKELAQLCALNALAALNLVSDVDKVARIVRVVGYVNGAPGFVNHPAVVNGASELFIALWGDENGKHARSAIGVAELPLNSPVEVELTFELKKK
jgi:enamine deaminase RidA (YjgF/YER057c/UK114 family)